MRTTRGMSSFALVVSLAFLGACRVTPEQIATWKGTQKGPGKLREVVLDGGADPKLRALAYVALIDIGLGQEAAHDLSTIDPRAHGAIAHEATDPLIAILGESVTRPVPTTAAQR